MVKHKRLQNGNMGAIHKTYFDGLIPSACDRNSNRVRVYQTENNEVVIHFRNLKIVLHTPQEINEWREGFNEALINLRAGNYFPNDI